MKGANQEQNFPTLIQKSATRIYHKEFKIYSDIFGDFSKLEENPRLKVVLPHC